LLNVLCISLQYVAALLRVVSRNQFKSHVSQ